MHVTWPATRCSFPRSSARLLESGRSTTRHVRSRYPKTGRNLHSLTAGGGGSNGKHSETQFPGKDRKQQDVQQPQNEDDEAPQLVVNMDKTSSVQVDNSGRVVDAEAAQKVHMDGTALEEPGKVAEAASKVTSTVMHAALGAIDVVSDATDDEKPSVERLQELEGKYRMLDDRLDLVEMRLVDLGKPREPKPKASASVEEAGAQEGQNGQEGQGGQGGGLKEVSKIQSRFTEAVNSGYIESMKQMRENLMLHEWELSNKYWAQRKGVSDFEAWCVEQGEEVDYELLSKLYERPVDAQLLQQLSPRQRSMARSCVEASCDQRMQEVYARCTETAKQFATLGTSGVASGAGSRILKFVKRLIPFKIPFIG